VKSKAVVQFSQTLGMLLEAGVTLSEALDIVSTSVDNGVLKKTLQQAKDNIVKEGKMAKHLSETGIFPPVPIHMIKTGEESGNLADMLTKVGNDADADLLESTNVLVQAINPVMTVVVAAVVLVVVLSIFLPIMELSDLGNMA
jgi:general secretion pathway protein F